MGFKLDNISLNIAGKQILDRVSLEAADGDFVCLLGPSGCGKTTTLRILSGLEAPDNGTITLNERTVFSSSTNIPPEKRRVGFLFQDFALFPHLNVADNIAFGLDRSVDSSAKVREMLAAVDMSDYAEAMPHSLSGGQQQRIALARAMAPEPDIMLLDEPFSGLDTALRIKLREITYDILKRNGTTTVMVTHDPEEAMFMADILALMDKGQVVESGSPLDLYRAPQTEFCARFMGDIYPFEGRVESGLLHTPLGQFEHTADTHQTSIRVYVRPENIRVTRANGVDIGSKRFRVESLHYLGEKSLITLQSDKDSGTSASQSIKAKLDPSILPGDYVHLSADRDKLILF